jgi:flavin-dependent dehydrogenase
MAGTLSRPIAVVGGSAAGLFAARELARHGRPVTVLEGRPELAPEPRTLIVTSRLRDVLPDLGEGIVVNTIRRFELLTDGRAATVTLERPDLVIERAALIRWLAAEAREAGATVLTGRRVRALRAERDRLALGVDRLDGGDNGRRGPEEIEADTVVGADGAFSRVARAAGWPPPTTVPLVQAIVRLPEDLPPDTVRVWFVPEDTPYFYWLIPDSPARGALGLIGEQGHETRRCLERFLKVRGFEPLAFQAARIPLYTGWQPSYRRFGPGEVYLVGDAAGHVKVTTVGGIVTGFRGAAAVVRRILGGPRQARGAFGALRRELNRHRLIRRAVHRFTERDYRMVVDLLGPRARHLLGRYTRDEAAALVARLLLAEPRLLLVGLRALVLDVAGRLRRG